MKSKPIKENPPAISPVAKQETRLSLATISDLISKDRWLNLFSPVNISSLVFFRILFGLIMLYEVVVYVSTDRVRYLFISPKYHFTYYPFDFVTPFPGDGMYYYFYFMGILSLFIVLGLFYRVTMFLFFIGFSYLYLLEQTQYLNHFYLVILVSFVLNFIPLNTSWSLDQYIFPKIKSDVIPAWCLWLIRFMIAIPYFWGGVAKINYDWLRGQPMTLWLQKNQYVDWANKLFDHDSVTLLMSYSGLFLDLFIVPALLFKKTRLIGLLTIFSFHIINSQIFDIGIFPWFMIVATTLFFEPDWPLRVYNTVFNTKHVSLATTPQHLQRPTLLNKSHKWIIASLLLWAGIQTALPLRHFFMPGSVHWTEAGHRYAWHMKLRSKKAIGTFVIEDKNSGRRQVISPESFLTRRQIGGMMTKPYLIWQFCQKLKKDWKIRGFDVAVYADIQASLNGRKFQQLIDPLVDIGSVSRPVFPVSWVIPLTTPLLEKNMVAIEEKEEDVE